KQFAAICRKFKGQGERGLFVLTTEIDKKLPPEAKDDGKEQLAKRQANAAVALLKMNQPDKVWPLLRHSPDPRVRSYLIHCLGPLGADAGAIVKRLDEEPDITIRRALLLSLGGFDQKALPPDARQVLLPRLQDMHRTEPDPGIHASAEWLLRQWQQNEWLRQTNDERAKDKEQLEKRLERIRRLVAKDKEKTPPQWYVNGQGQTMVVIPGPVEFLMGSPATEDRRVGNELQHRRRIGRTFAIAAKSVTVKQYREFSKGYEFQGVRRVRGIAPTEDCPVDGTDWYMAAAYCNWLSDQEGLKDQQCYETNPQGGVTR